MTVGGSTRHQHRPQVEGGAWETPASGCLLLGWVQAFLLKGCRTGRGPSSISTESHFSPKARVQQPAASERQPRVPGRHSPTQSWALSYRAGGSGNPVVSSDMSPAEHQRRAPY